MLLLSSSARRSCQMRFKVHSLGLGMQLSTYLPSMYRGPGFHIQRKQKGKYGEDWFIPHSSKSKMQKESGNTYWHPLKAGETHRYVHKCSYCWGCRSRNQSQSFSAGVPGNSAVQSSGSLRQVCLLLWTPLCKINFCEPYVASSLLQSQPQTQPLLQISWMFSPQETMVLT